MDATSFALGLLAGCAAGAAAALWFSHWRRRAVTSALDQATAHLKESFGSLSYEALTRALEHLESASSKNLLAQAQAQGKEEAERRFALQGQLRQMNDLLKESTRVMTEMERNRQKSFGEVATRLEDVGDRAAALGAETSRLRELFSGGQQRGQWGERMADDLLAALGLQEGVNFERQPTLEHSGTRPDYLFLLPDGHRLAMDVKFPWDNYRRYAEAEEGALRDQYLQAFCKDVRARVKEVAARGYVSPRDRTLDFQILFIPSEGLFRLLLERDPDLLDSALQAGVVMASPTVLYALLAVVRHAGRLFTLQQQSTDVLKLLDRFRTQWAKFTEHLEALGRRLESAQEEYGRLSGVRTRQMEKVLVQVEELTPGVAEREDL